MLLLFLFSTRCCITFVVPTLSQAIRVDHWSLDCFFSFCSALVVALFPLWRRNLKIYLCRIFFEILLNCLLYLCHVLGEIGHLAVIADKGVIVKFKSGSLRTLVCICVSSIYTRTIPFLLCRRSDFYLWWWNKIIVIFVIAMVVREMCYFVFVRRFAVHKSKCTLSIPAMLKERFLTLVMKPDYYHLRRPSFVREMHSWS